MQIRIGNSFRDGSQTMQVFGFTEGEERRILVVTQTGERADVSPWDLMSNCALEPGKDPQAVIAFDSDIHGPRP